MVPLILVLTLASVALGMDNGVARYPPKGWRSWERFRCNVNCENDPQNCISANLFKVMADRLIEEEFVQEYDENPWNYVMVDDCWSDRKRNSDGTLRPDYVRFEYDGIKALADYMHDRKMKLGIHIDLGPRTCNGYLGSKGHFEQDAKTLAEWGVDMVHIDACTADVNDLDTDFPEMVEYLNETGRPMYISCAWPKYLRRKGIEPDYRKIAHYCNSWRLYEDVEDSWTSVVDAFDYYGNNTGHFVEVAGQGAWNDMGTLVVGDYGLSYDEQKVQMSLWSIMSSPLFMSMDLRKLSSQSKALLQNDWLSNINMFFQAKPGYRFRKLVVGDFGLSFDEQKVQMSLWSMMASPLFMSMDLRKLSPQSKALLQNYRLYNVNMYYQATPGYRFRKTDTIEIWEKHMAPEGKTTAYAFVNTAKGGGPQPVEIQFTSLGLNEYAYNVTTVFEQRFVGVYRPHDWLNITVDPSGVYMGMALYDP